MENRRFWRLDILIPTLLLGAFLSDAAARFVRLEPLAFRADEALSQFGSVRTLGPYEANRVYRNERSSGDLAVMSNLPEYRTFREQVFTTDENGFRNVPDPRALPPDILMVGSSFTVGSGNSDSQTLPARLESRSGCRTYNAGNASQSADALLEIARNRGMRGGLIIMECLERMVGAPILPSRGPRKNWLPYQDELRAIYQTAYLRLQVSPLKVICQRLYKSLQNDRILPNIHKDVVAVRHLRDGQPTLFLREHEKPKRVEDIPQNVDAYAKLRDDLRAGGFDLALVIVPEKLTVYRSLLRETVVDGADGKSALAELERSARARGLTIVNLAPVLTDRAHKSLEASEILYWPDDTHWNPRGIDVAAEAICDALGLRERCGKRQANPPTAP